MSNEKELFRRIIERLITVLLGFNNGECQMNNVVDMHKHDKTKRAYTMRIDNKWWVFIWTPSGMIVRINIGYPDEAAAEHAIGVWGYRKVTGPHDPMA